MWVRKACFLGAVFSPVLVLLSACSGGSDAVPVKAIPVVAVYGDSLTSSHLGTWPHRLQVPVVRRINELASGKFVAIDYSQPGAITQNSLDGAATLPAGPFAEHVQANIAGTVLLRWGGADAILGVAPHTFRTNLAGLVRSALNAGRRVVVVGLFQHPDPRIAEFDAIARSVANDAGVLFISTIEVSGGLVDGLHPDQAYADAMVAVIVAQLKEAL